jgi:hypothetical protein
MRPGGGMTNKPDQQREWARRHAATKSATIRDVKLPEFSTISMLRCDVDELYGTLDFLVAELKAVGILDDSFQAPWPSSDTFEENEL